MSVTARALLAGALLASASIGWAEPSPPASAEWVARSNANATPLLEVLAKYAPETAAALGVEGFDAEVFDLRPRNAERFEADLADCR
jgi:hypothetical protein